LRRPVGDILNLSPHPLDWARQIVEDLPCNEIATTTNHHKDMSSPIFASTADLIAASISSASVNGNDENLVNYLTITESHIDQLDAAAKIEGAHDIRRICGLARKGYSSARLAAVVAFNDLASR
jgi:hypothetical protein